MNFEQKYSRRTALKLIGFGSAAAALAACAPAAPVPAATEGGEASAPAEKITISISHIGGGSVEASEKSQRMMLLRESFPDINFDNQWVSYAGYLEKIPLAIASGDLADMQFCNAFNDIPLMMEADILLEVGGLLEEYGKNILAVTPEQAWDSTLYDGAQMALAHNVYDLNIWLSIYRKDWLDTLGLGIPQTIDEYGEALLAFSKNDPDGNGADDTYGRLLYNTIRFDDDIFHAFGVAVGHHMNGFWRERDGALALDWIHPQMKDALAWMRNIWAQGGFHPDSISIPLGHGSDAFLGGFAGNMYSSWVGFDSSFERLHAVDDRAVLAPGPAPEGPGGRGFTGEGWPWCYVIPKTAQYPEECVKVLDFFYTPDIVAQVFCDGVLGVTNKGLDENGWCVEFTREEKAEMGDKWAEMVNENMDVTTYQGWWLPYNTVGATPLFANFPDDIRAHFEEILKNKYSETALEARDISQEYIRLTEKKRPVPSEKESWPGLQTRFAEFISQAVSGTIDLDQGWDEWLAYFEANGGPTITEQVNQL
jgi:ABC-type glycerol-3-phosphate transport system substrate-binding protein